MADHIKVPDDDGLVGYGHPPKAHQFKKGQSGNPRGRPRQPSEPEQIIPAILQRKVPVTIDGKLRMKPILEALALKAVQSATTGDHKPLMQLVRLIPELSLGYPVPPYKERFREALRRSEESDKHHMMRMFAMFEMEDALFEAGAMVVDDEELPVFLADALERMMGPDPDPERLRRVRAKFGKRLFDPGAKA